MKPDIGSVVLIRLRGVGGVLRLRPALVLATLPGAFQSVLVCGISTARLDDVGIGWDEVLDPNDADFQRTGLRRRSAARLSFLFSVTEDEVEGAIGAVAEERLARLRARLAAYLATPLPAVG